MGGIRDVDSGGQVMDKKIRGQMQHAAMLDDEQYANDKMKKAFGIPEGMKSSIATEDKRFGKSYLEKCIPIYLAWKKLKKAFTFGVRYGSMEKSIKSKDENI